MAESLSPREAEILRLIASGKTTKEIGAELSIAESTVNWHVGNLHSKLGASSRAEAVAVAMTAGTLEGASDEPEEASASSDTPRTARRWSRRAATVGMTALFAVGILLSSGTTLAGAVIQELRSDPKDARAPLTTAPPTPTNQRGEAAPTTPPLPTPPLPSQRLP